MHEPVFWLVAAPAIFLVGLSKSGLVTSLGIMTIPLLSLVMPVRDAAGIMLPILMVMDAIGLIAYRRSFSLDILRILIPGMIVGLALGWIMFALVSDAMILLAIGLIAFIFVLDAVLPLRKKMEGKAPSKPWGWFWGMVSGFTSFLTHTGGPPYQVYVLPQRLPPPVYAGTTAWFFAIVNALKLGPYFILGQLSPANLTLAAMLVPAAIAGMLIGLFLVRRVSTKLFYRMTYTLVFFLSLKLIYDGAMGLLG